MIQPTADGKFEVLSEDGQRPLGKYDTREEAEQRLAQVERMAERSEQRR